MIVSLNHINWKIENQQVVLKINYSWAVCLNANYDGKARNYYLSLTEFNCQKLKKIFPAYDFPVSQLPNEKTALQLRRYQQEDVNFLSKQKSIAIFNEMRTGKTPTALMIFQQWSVDNLLIICPGILQTQWQESVERWLNKSAYVISYLPLTDRQVFYQKFCQEKGWIIIVSKDIFKIDAEYFKDLRKKKVVFCTIIDEAHFLRNYQSQQSKSIYTLKDSQYKMVLTGTPMVNHSIDIFGILKFLQPTVYTSYWKFAEEFFLIYQNSFKKRVLGFKSEEKQKAFQILLNQFSVSRKQREVLPWLPLIESKEEKLLMAEDQQNVYSRWTQKWDKNYPLEFLAKLKTLTLYPPGLIREEENKRDFLTEKDRQLLKKCQGSKITYLINFCQENSDQSIIIFSTRSETFLEPLAKFLQENIKKEIGLITGKVSPQQRNDFIDSFQQKKIKILLCNIQSAGMGLKLSEADIAIFADRSYSPADNEQAEARFLPTQANENRKVRTIIDLTCKGTIDEKILSLLKKKKDITKIVSLMPEYFF